MSETPKSPGRIQIHLSTAIVLAFAAGMLVPVNMLLFEVTGLLEADPTLKVRPWDMWSGRMFLLSMQLPLLVLIAWISEYLIRRRISPLQKTQGEDAS